jgi:3-oxoacyl-[acyl-carrier protein] reductase
LGKAIAWALAREGARVAICARNQERLERTGLALHRASGREIFAYPTDLSTRTGPQDFVEATVKEFGRLDILVCNAGGPPATSSVTTPAEAWGEALELSLLSTIRLTQAAIPYMRRNSWGRVVCLTSVSVKSPLPGMILSNTARPGVAGFAKTIAAEFAQDGITVNVVCPGYMATDRVTELAEVRAAQSGEEPEDVMAQLVENIPAGRMGEPKELGDLVAFLASERAAYITGTTIQIDGGYVRGLL